MNSSRWASLLTEHRRKKSKATTIPHRTSFERDFDRVLFSAPVRRLSDKTQVFPLDSHDGVRTRLTHSLEVANLARSIGRRLVYEGGPLESIAGSARTVPPLLATVGLAHDLGNPPFGHQGETAIQQWFADRFAENKNFFENEMSDAMRRDFLQFEGNAQTLRILTRLQIRDDDYGLDLACGTLGAVMKYTVPSDRVRKDSVSSKKHGFFQSEASIVRDIWERCGLEMGKRHALAYIMEACDDIAYATLDVEDAIKKGLVSYHDLDAYLRHEAGTDPLVTKVLDKQKTRMSRYYGLKISPSEVNDLVMQRFRADAMELCVTAIVATFTENLGEIEAGSFSKSLVDASAASPLIRSLKDFAFQRAYKHRSVLEIELRGHAVIQQLMTYFWEAISAQITGHHSPFTAYVFSRISESHRRVFDREYDGLPRRYRAFQLVTDMVSGMTDGYALLLHHELVNLNFAGTPRSDRPPR